MIGPRGIEIHATRLAKCGTAAIWCLKQLSEPVLSYEEDGQAKALHLDCTPHSQRELRRLIAAQADVDFCYRVARVTGHV